VLRLEISQQIARDLNNVLLKTMKANRFGDGKKKQGRGKQIPAGKSYTAVTSISEDDVESEF
jgi:hypothetical protein